MATKDTGGEGDNGGTEAEIRYVERIKAKLEERATINADLAEICKAAKEAGFNITVLRAVAKRSLETSDEAEDRRWFEEQRDALLVRLGEFSNTPLGNSSVVSLERRSGRRSTMNPEDRSAA